MVDFSKLIKKNSKQDLHPKVKVGHKISFIEDEKPFNVTARNYRFLFCTRRFDKVTDQYIIDYSLKMGAFSNEAEALEYYTGEIVYTIVDLKERIRGSHNIVLGTYDFEDLYDIKRLLSDLDRGDTKISSRNSVKLNYNILKTDK